MTTFFRHLRVVRDTGQAITVWLDVAERKVNVFAEAVVDELQELFDSFLASRDLTPIVIRSAKPGGFLAGADLRQLVAFQSVAEVARFLERGQRLLDRLEQLPQPTVAVVHGACLGGGLELALACKHRIARDDPATQLGLPETRLELTPAWGGTRRLPRLIGLEAGLRMMLSGNSVGVDEAGRLGLIDAVARSESFDADVGDFVRRVTCAVDSGDVVEQRSRNLGVTSTFAVPPHRRARLRVMAAARRLYCDGSKGTPAQRAVLGAADAAYEDAGRDEQTTIRDDFACLVLSDECRRRLAEFFR